MKNFLITIEHSFSGQYGVKRLKEVYREAACTPEIATKRSMREYRKNIRGKKNLSYYITVQPLGAAELMN